MVIIDKKISSVNLLRKGETKSIGIKLSIDGNAKKNWGKGEKNVCRVENRGKGKKKSTKLGEII
jgi:hypothetical protein